MKKINVMHYFQDANCKLIKTHWSLFTENSFRSKQVYRLVALENVSIPPQHVMIVPGTIPGWKAPPVARVALFEPHERFIYNEKQLAQDTLFSVLKKEQFPSRLQTRMIKK